MKIFATWYDYILEKSKHKNAPKFLFLLSFSEAVFFPIPPDVMIAPMAIKQPQKALFFGYIATIASVIGGILGYVIGFFLSGGVENFMNYLGYGEKFVTLNHWFDNYGIWVVFIAGLTPLPFKFVTLLAGAMMMNFPEFVIMAIISRAIRLCGVAKLAGILGEHFEKQIRQSIEHLGFIVVLLLAIYCIYHFIN